MIEFFDKLPREIKLHIIKFLDIDSRRALKVYSTLNIPKNLRKKLENIPKINKESSLFHDYYISSIHLGNRSILLNNNVLNLSIYNLQILDFLPTKVIIHLNSETSRIESYKKKRPSLEEYDLINAELCPTFKLIQ